MSRAVGSLRTRSRRWPGLLALALATQAVLTVTLLPRASLDDYGPAELLAWLSIPLWTLAVWSLSRLRLTPRRAALVVLGGGLVLQALAMTHKPTTSDDDYRYMWDAKVQLSGVDPYRLTPADPALASLRDASLFGPPDHCQHAFPGGCTSINRPTVHTVYPPVAEGGFTLIRVLSFGGQGNHLPLQIAAVLGCLAIGWLLLRRFRAPPWRAALWAWCPVVVIEFANNAHIDWLGVLFVVAALAARGVWSRGGLLGAAIAVKLYPALLLPSLLRRSWLTAVAALGLVVLVYLPHLAVARSAVLGYLPGYLQEEQYGSGGRLRLLGAVLPHPVDTVVGALAVAAAALWAWSRGPVDAPARSAAVVTGVTLLCFTPEYGWYAGMLLALVAISGSLEWLPVVLAPMLCYLLNGHSDRLVWVVALLLTVAIAAARRPDSLRTCLRPISRGTGR
ncbi:glycosyltransferase 87 family protein [uncultured Jatrophihabitans sp.]|uniref:glycosyltransferase 87 family protein n=1 Tax=uncultured Jatrophihabitans sp. TaxID=1610747 RepID=UPI0035CB3FCA